MAVRLPLVLAAVAAALLLLRSGGAEARVLLTLDDFGAVGDGIANDTQVGPSRSSSRQPASTERIPWHGHESRPRSTAPFPEPAGFLGRVDRRVHLQRAGRPRRAGWQGLPDLAGAALRALQEEAQAAGTCGVVWRAAYRTVPYRTVLPAGAVPASIACCVLLRYILVVLTMLRCAAVRCAR